MYRYIAKVVPANSSLLFDRPLASSFPVGSFSLEGGQRFYLSNTARGLENYRLVDENPGIDTIEGAFFFNMTSGNLTLQTRSRTTPPPGIVPLLNAVIGVNGANNVACSHIQLSYTKTGPHPSVVSYGQPSYGALELRNTRNVTFVSSSVKHTGATGLLIGINTHDVDVQNSVFADVGGRGLSIQLHEAEQTSNVAVNNSVFQGCGRIFLQQPYCVFLTGSANISLTHSDISDVPYGAVRVFGNG
jgi:hypothetical protein